MHLKYEIILADSIFSLTHINASSESFNFLENELDIYTIEDLENAIS